MIIDSQNINRPKVKRINNIETIDTYISLYYNLGRRRIQRKNRKKEEKPNGERINRQIKQS